jgi:hypothetical protein
MLQLITGSGNPRNIQAGLNLTFRFQVAGALRYRRNADTVARMRNGAIVEKWSDCREME